MKKVWALDFGPDSAFVAAAEARPDGELHLLGIGESPALGFAGGDLKSLGDVTEAVVSALRQAEEQAGFKCQTLFFNLDDPELESCHSTGSKMLAGEGQIRQEDVRDAMETAMRMLGRFERSTAYSCATGYLIDGKDWVANPVGIFGRQLDVSMHAVLARAEHCERWQRVMERSHLKEGIPVLSVLSAVYGVLRPEDHARNLLLWDLGRDMLSAAWVQEGSVRRALSLRTEALTAAEISSAVTAHSKKISEEAPGIEEMVLTGDWAEKDAFVERIRGHWDKPLSVKAPWGVPELCELSRASLVGLMRLAARSRSGPRSSPLGKHLVVGLRQKAVSLINEYF